MLPTQIAETNPDHFFRCKEAEQKATEHGESLSPGQKTDAAIKGSINDALGKDEILRVIESYAMDVHVKNGIVYLSGHIVNTSSRNRIEKAIRAISGIVGIQNNLVLDDKLTLEVAGSLGTLE